MAEEQEQRQQSKEDYKVRILYTDENGDRHQVVFSRLQPQKDNSGGRRNEHQLSEKSMLSKGEKGISAPTDEDWIVTRLNDLRGLGIPKSDKDFLAKVDAPESPCPNSRVVKVAEDQTNKESVSHVYAWDWGKLNNAQKNQLLEGLSTHIGQKKMARDSKKESHKTDNKDGYEVIVDENLTNKEQGQHYYKSHEVEKLEKQGQLNGQQLSEYYHQAKESRAFQTIDRKTSEFLDAKQDDVDNPDDPGNPDDDDNPNNTFDTAVIKPGQDNDPEADPNANTKPSTIQDKHSLNSGSAAEEYENFEKLDKSIVSGVKNLSHRLTGMRGKKLNRLANTLRASREDIRLLVDAHSMHMLRNSEKEREQLRSHLEHHAQANSGVQYNTAFSQLSPYIQASNDLLKQQDRDDLGEESGQSVAKEYTSSMLPVLERMGDRPRPNDKLDKIYDYGAAGFSAASKAMIPFKFAAKSIEGVAKKMWSAFKFATPKSLHQPIGNTAEKVSQGVKDCVSSVDNAIPKPSYAKDDSLGDKASKERKGFAHDVNTTTYETLDMPPDEYRGFVREYYDGVLESVKKGVAWGEDDYKKHRPTSKHAPFSGFSSIKDLVNTYRYDKAFLDKPVTDSNGDYLTSYSGKRFTRHDKMNAFCAHHILQYYDYPGQGQDPDNLMHYHRVELPQSIDDEIAHIKQSFEANPEQHEVSGEGSTSSEMCPKLKYNIKRHHVEDDEGNIDEAALKRELQIQYRNKIKEPEDFVNGYKDRWIRQVQQALQDAKNDGTKEINANYISASDEGRLTNRTHVLNVGDYDVDDESKLYSQLEDEFDKNIKNDVQDSASTLAQLRHIDAQKDYGQQYSRYIKGQYVSIDNPLYQRLNATEEDFICREAFQEEAQQTEISNLQYEASRRAKFRNHALGDMNTLSSKEAEQLVEELQQIKQDPSNSEDAQQAKQVLDQLRQRDDIKQKLAKKQLEMLNNPDYMHNVIGQRLLDLKAQVKEDDEDLLGQIKYKVFDDNFGLAEKERTRQYLDEMVPELYQSSDFFLWFLALSIQLHLAIETGTSQYERENATISGVNKAKYLSTAFQKNGVGLFEKALLNRIIDCTTRDENGVAYVDMDKIDSDISASEILNLAHSDKIVKDNSVTEQAVYMAAAGLAESMGVKVEHAEATKKGNSDDLVKGAHEMCKFYDSRKIADYQKLYDLQKEEKASHSKEEDPQAELGTSENDKGEPRVRSPSGNSKLEFDDENPKNQSVGIGGEPNPSAPSFTK